jgi:PAS domain S-box-containing protein
MQHSVFDSADLSDRQRISFGCLGNNPAPQAQSRASALASRSLWAQSPEHLGALIAEVSDAIIGKTLDGKIATWNNGARNVYGYAAEEVIGRRVSMLYPRERRHELRRFLEAAKRGERIEDFETVRVRKDGALVNVCVTVIPVRDAGGAIIGAFTISEDLTALQCLQKAVHLSDRLATVGRMTASIAHEVNNAADALGNVLFLLRHCAGLDAAAYEHAISAEQELKRIAQLTRGVLGYCRDSRHPTTVNTAELLDSVLELYAPKLRSCGINLRRAYEDVPALKCCPSELRQVFSNLLINAIHAVHDHGEIRVHACAGCDWANPARHGIRIVVADNGVGIPAEQRKHLFKCFYSTKGENGNGLGLWVTQGIVHKHGGTIRVRSSTRPGRTGTCFSIFLPVGAESQSSASAA